MYEEVTDKVNKIITNCQKRDYLGSIGLGGSKKILVVEKIGQRERAQYWDCIN